MITNAMKYFHIRLGRLTLVILHIVLWFCGWCGVRLHHVVVHQGGTPAQHALKSAHNYIIPGLSDLGRQSVRLATNAANPGL